MSNNPQIAAPGSSTYDSNTLHVGDGTWDASRDDFLLPNLVGMNFATMRYNGMANRFRDLDEYHSLVRAHGIVAALVFLFIIPLAVFMARFYWRDPRFALRVHIWCQILVVFLSTIVLIVGWFAVGPRRSLTNPHHGIGVALYVLIIVQAIGGTLIRRWERRREGPRVSVKMMLHQWMGRAIALLGMAQIPLGLTLYGSPKVLFILYSLWMFTLILFYFIFSHRYQGGGVSGSESYYSGSRTDYTGEGGRRRHGLLAPLAAGGLAAAAIGALSRRRSDRTGSRTEVTHDSRPSGSFVEEKHSESDRDHDHTWRNRLLAGAGAAGVFGLARHFFKGKREEEEGSDFSSGYHQAPEGQYGTSRTSLGRVEEGMGPTTPPANRIGRHDANTIPVSAASPSRHSRLRPRKSGESLNTYQSQDYYSPGQDKRNTHTFRDGIAALGVAGYLKHKFNQSRNAKDDKRVAQMRDEEHERDRIANENNQRRRYTGDGRPPRRNGSLTESEMTPIGGSTPALSRHSLHRPGAAAGVGLAAGAVLGAAAAAAVGAGGNRTHMPPGPDPHQASSHNLGPPPPRVSGGHLHDSSGSEMYNSGEGSRPHRHNGRDAALAAGAAGLGAAAGAAVAGHSNRPQSSVGSPPLSIKMRMRNDGNRQHVTLRRLSPQEAAAEREARRRDRRSRDNTGSISSVAGSGEDRWRRVEARERAEAAQMSQNQQQGGFAGPSSRIPMPPPPPPPVHSSSSPTAGMDLPPPPPIPASAGLGGGSPGSESATGSRADSNRRRRRAERARAEQAARESRGTRVDFT